ncbi:MAG TPA: RNA 3'-terminal phosphate cyclase [Blastocatellia bacterium]|jgi:RNA 3'-terminal phosphate cyclase (ATP)
MIIDGSHGEGGGQVLRTSLALSLLTGKPFRIEKIRAGRKNPGLLRQHLTAVNAAQEISRAEVAGASIGSRELEFAPGKPQAGNYSFAVGTAGSATLVLQTVLPALLTVGESAIALEGGTHNPFAPPFDFLAKTFLPIINRMGAHVRATLERPGFYPAGGGRFTVEVEPAVRLNRIDLVDRGKIILRRARAIVANLPVKIAERELGVIRRKLSWNSEWLASEEIRDGRGPGNVVMIEIESQNICEVFTAFGERGVTAETVANRAAQEARVYLAAQVVAGEHLADQLLLPMAMAGGGSFTTLPLSRHATTNIDIIKKFLDVEIAVTELDRRACRVDVKGARLA